MKGEKKLPNRLREWRLARDLSQQRLADLSGTTKAQIGKLEKGDRRLTQEWMERLAGPLRIEPGWLLRSSAIQPGGEENQYAKQLAATKVTTIKRENESGRLLSGMGITNFDLGRRDLPVLGVAQGGREGILIIPVEQAPVDMTYRPPQLAGVKDAFAVFAYDDSMAPMYRHGQTLWIYPAAPVRPEDGVLLIKANDHALIKQLVRRTANAIVLREYRPKRREFAIPTSDIRHLYRIIGALDPIR